MTSPFWARKVYAVLIGALLMWVTVELLFVIAGTFWKEFLGGWKSYMLISLALITLGPALGYAAARTLEATRPMDCARWCLGPSLMLLLYHLLLCAGLRREIAEVPAFGFAQLANTGAWLGASLGIFGGMAYARRDSKRSPKLPITRRLACAAVGAGAGALASGLLGSLLDFSWRSFGLGEEWYMYFFLFLVLGTPFLLAGLANALGDAHPAWSAVWAVVPSFAALYLATRGSAGLVDLSRAGDISDRMPELGGLVGAAGGAMAGLSFRRRIWTQTGLS